MKYNINILFVVILFSSCYKEYEHFYPYKNNNISYLEHLKGEKQVIVFRNANGLKYSNQSGFVISIDKNSFDANIDSVILQWKLVDSKRKILAERFSMIDKSNSLISPIVIIDFKIVDKKGNETDLVKDKFVSFYFPDNSNSNPGIHRFSKDYWILSKNGEDQLSKQVWTVVNENQTKHFEGILLKTHKIGILGLTTYLEKKWKSEDLKIYLKDGYDVSNSIVQIVIPDSKFNLELLWNIEKKAFVIPDNFFLPSNRLNIIVLSQDSNMNPYFGMKYAEFTDENTIKVDVFKAKIEEIEQNLDKI